MFNGNQCTRVVKNALDAGGFANGETIEYNSSGAGQIKSVVPAWLPITKQKSIEKRNKGRDVTGSIRRN
jgi:hypothetical protein